MNLVRCPTCDKPFDPSKSQSMPFCSTRCRLIDLNRWLREDISIPVIKDPDEQTPDEPHDHED